MRASDRAHTALREQILDWSLPPGTVLAEVEQAARLGVSRTPLREALARLAGEGLVETQAGRGLVVTPAGLEDAAALFEVREALESKAVALAADRGRPEVFAALRAEFDTVGLDDRAAYYDLVRRFDEAIDEAIANPYLAGELRGSRTHLARIRRLAQDDRRRLAAAAAEHALIADAIAARDADLARSALTVHLHRSLSHITGTTDAPPGKKAPPGEAAPGKKAAAAPPGKAPPGKTDTATPSTSRRAPTERTERTA